MDVDLDLDGRLDLGDVHADDVRRREAQRHPGARGPGGGGGGGVVLEEQRGELGDLGVVGEGPVGGQRDGGRAGQREGVVGAVGGGQRELADHVRLDLAEGHGGLQLHGLDQAERIGETNL